MGMLWIAKSCCLEYALSVLVMSEFIAIIQVSTAKYGTVSCLCKTLVVSGFSCIQNLFSFKI